MTALRVAFFWLGLLLSGAAKAATTVWIDTDPAIGAPWREVDDAFALVLAFHSPEIEIAGISTTYGNAALARTSAVARELVRRFGAAAQLTERDVYPGARSASARAQRTVATEALARVLRKKRLTYIALGPLTNLAAFLELHPGLADRIERVICVGGRSPQARFAFGPEKSFAVHDANVFKDPAAVATVLRASPPLLFAPVEIAPELALTSADLRKLRDGSAAGDYLFHHTRVWLWFWTNVVREKGGLAFDVIAILPVLQANLLQTETRFAQFDLQGDLVAQRAPGPGRRRVQFAIGLRKQTTKPLVLERLKRRPAN